MKCYHHYLILLILVASFSSCKKDFKDSLPAETTTDSKQIALLNAGVIEEEQITSSSDVTEEQYGLHLFVRIRKVFPTLFSIGLPSEYSCYLSHDTSPSISDAVIDHNLSGHLGYPQTSYAKYMETAGYGKFQTVGKCIASGAGGTTTYWVTANIEYLGRGQYKIKIKLEPRVS